MFPLIHLGWIEIPTYYLLISFGSLMGIGWFLRRTPKAAELTAVNVAIFSMIAGFVGARLLHVVFEEPAYYAAHPLNILKFWEGGFVFYGGLLAAFLAAIVYLSSLGQPLLPWFDRASLPIGLAYMIGRVGCFLNGCCYGRYCSWGFVFPSHAALGLPLVPRHPTQLYAVTSESLALLLLLFGERKGYFKKPGQLFWCWLSLHAVGRIIMEHWRDDDRGAMIVGLSISTWISLGLLAVALFCLFRPAHRLQVNLEAEKTGRNR